MKTTTLLLAPLALCITLQAAQAAVTPEQAAELGQRLTRWARSAPATPTARHTGLGRRPAHRRRRHAAGRLAQRPLRGAEKPLFTITAQNLEQYRERLSTGQQALFKRYPASYRMPVYPNHRSASLPEPVYQAIARNAVKAQLVAGGNGLQDFETATPFPSRRTAWRWCGTTSPATAAAAPDAPTCKPRRWPTGTFSPVYFKQQFTYRDQLKDFDPQDPGNVLFYYKQLVTAPARLAGDVVLVHETLDQVKEPRMAWIYNAGQRRVRRAPQIAYDGPYPSPKASA